MRICIPVEEDRGASSPVCPHFGSAPLFIVADTEGGTFEAIANGDAHHSHGMCRPLAALAGARIDAVAVGGVGMGALGKLREAGIGVYISDRGTVEETLAALKSGSLPAATPATACAHHGHQDHGGDPGRGHHGHGGQPHGRGPCGGGRAW